MVCKVGRRVFGCTSLASLLSRSIMLQPARNAGMAEATCGFGEGELRGHLVGGTHCIYALPGSLSCWVSLHSTPLLCLREYIFLSARIPNRANVSVSHSRYSSCEVVSQQNKLHGPEHTENTTAGQRLLSRRLISSSPKIAHHKYEFRSQRKLDTQDFRE